MYKVFFKRIFDTIVSAITIVILAPVFILISICIKLDSKGPVLFKQKRLGKRKKPFTVYKFRTMRIDAPCDIPTYFLEEADKYITRLGKFLRRSSLDELPQFVNVFIGQMSLVGPRPSQDNEYELIAAREKANVYSILPGLTGLAQINGRDELSQCAKAGYDAEYASSLSFWLDIKCLFKTVLRVISADGIVEGKKERNDTPITSAALSSKPLISIAKNRDTAQKKKTV